MVVMSKAEKQQLRKKKLTAFVLLKRSVSNEVKDLVAELAEFNEMILDTALVTKILNALPHSYGYFSAIAAGEEKIPSFTQLSGRLISEEDPGSLIKRTRKLRCMLASNSPCNTEDEVNPEDEDVATVYKMDKATVQLKTQLVVEDDSVVQLIHVIDVVEWDISKGLV
ncbi:hypothetical protein R1flu_015387 [Riccia fluitans]|uniref:Uncharacterized protein n=1 Tax=Riccia fluitans TaxID=41844 RepID=A0ABD1YIU5_9MARC